MIAELKETQCCGIRELDGVMEQSAEESVTDAAQAWFEDDMDGAFIFFSVTNNSSRGRDMVEFIEKHDLGTVAKMRPTINPNSDNMLTMYVWTVNKSHFKSFWHKTDRYKEDYKDNDW